MSREIKFEYGFQSQNGIIKKVYALSQIPNISQLCDLWNELPIAYVREFTGIKDKNGKEIYEGDIDSNGYVVKFKYGAFVLEKETSWFYLSDGDCMEIISNIYENPELLQP